MSKSQRTAVYDHVKVLSSMIVMYNRNMMVNVVRIDATPRMASNAMANRDGIRGRAIFQACCDDPSPEKKSRLPFSLSVRGYRCRNRHPVISSVRIVLQSVPLSVRGRATPFRPFRWRQSRDPVGGAKVLSMAGGIDG